MVSFLLAYVKPVCLPPTNLDIRLEEDSPVVAGWNLVGEGGERIQRMGQLLRTRTSFANEQRCLDLYQGFFKRNHVC